MFAACMHHLVSMLLERALRVVLHSWPWCSGEHMLYLDSSAVGPSEMHGCRVGSELLQAHSARVSTGGKASAHVVAMVMQLGQASLA